MMLQPSKAVSVKSKVSGSQLTNVGTSIAAPIVGSVLSTFIAYEALMTDTKTVRKRMLDNSLQNLITGLPSDNPRQTTPNILVNTGISLYSFGQGPYIGAPSDDDGELKVRSVPIEGRSFGNASASNSSIPEASATMISMCRVPSSGNIIAWY